MAMFVAYVAATFALCFSGLWIVPGWRPWLVGSFVLAALVLFSAGYGSKVLTVKWSSSQEVSIVQRLRPAVVAMVALKLIVLSLGFWQYSRTQEISIQSLVNPGESYRSALAITTEASMEVSNVGRLEVITAPLWFLALPLAVFWWRLWGPKTKLFLSFAIVSYVVTSVLFLGRQKSAGDVLIIILSSVFLEATRRKRFVKHVILSVAICMVVGFLFMTWNQYSRLQAYGALETYGGHEMMQLNKSHILYRFFPDHLVTSAAVAVSYFHNGFFGLSFCLEQPFEWTYGVGHSFALMGYVDQYLGNGDLIYNTYPLRAESATGWPSMMFWETIFPWLASDLSYPGTLVFCFFLGRLYATTWLESLRFKNPLSIALFATLNIMLVYFPANNQLFQLRESALGTYGLLCCWLFLHRRFNGQRGAVSKGFALSTRQHSPI